MERNAGRPAQDAPGAARPGGALRSRPHRCADPAVTRHSVPAVAAVIPLHGISTPERASAGRHFVSLREPWPGPGSTTYRENTREEIRYSSTHDHAGSHQCRLCGVSGERPTSGRKRGVVRSVSRRHAPLRKDWRHHDGRQAVGIEARSRGPAGLPVHLLPARPAWPRLESDRLDGRQVKSL